MLPVQSIARTVPLVCKTVVQRRAMSVISGPPRNKVSFAEKAALGTIMTAGLLAVPTWVLVHLKVYTAGQ